MSSVSRSVRRCRLLTEDSLGDQHRPTTVAENPFEEVKPHINEYTAQEIATLSSRLEKQLGPEYISTRPGASGQRVPYLAADKAINLANEVFGFNGWSSCIKQIQIDFVSAVGASIIWIRPLTLLGGREPKHGEIQSRPVGHRSSHAPRWNLPRGDISSPRGYTSVFNFHRISGTATLRIAKAKRPLLKRQRRRGQPMG